MVLLCSLGGEQFVQFVMSPTAEGDDVYLYEQLVEPVLQSGACSSWCKIIQQCILSESKA